ncbi:MAG: AlbA family DNA-binding domain-containing protein [Candidatus Saccharibacteria bacterium]
MAEKDIKSKVPTRDEIKKLITAGDPTAFIGLQETAFFEVRDHRYDTAAKDRVKLEKAKQTFATDVSTIANSGGGYILLGFATDTPAGTRIEYIKSVSGVKRELIDLDALRNILREHTVPRITLESLKHGFIGEGNKSVFWVQIPDAKATGQYPVLIRKARWGVDNDEFLKGEMFALFHRDGAENLIESAEQIQQILAAASQKDADPQTIAIARYQELSEKIDRLVGMGGPVPKADPQELVGDFLAQAKSGMASDQGVFYILAKPTGQANFKNFWDDDFQGKNLYHLMKNPPTLRRMGWGLDVASGEMPMPMGSAWEIRNGNRKFLQVTADSEVFGAISVDTILNWGTGNYLPADGSVDTLINEVALIEYIYNFMVFVAELGKLNGGLDEYDVYYGFDLQPDLKASMLSPHHIGPHTFYDVKGQLGTHRTWTGKFSPGELPQVAAGRYALDITKGGFSITETPTPIHRNDDGVYAVRVDFFTKLYS